MGLSNKTLIALASVTAALLLFSMFILIEDTRITGMATASGSVNITISPVLEITFNVSSLNFGSGYVTPGSNACVLGTNTTAEPGCSLWESKAVGLALENTGSVYARVNLTNTNYSSSFFAGPDSSAAGYAIRITTPKGNATTCQGMAPEGSIVIAANRTWYNLTQALNITNMLCATMNISDLADTVQIDFSFSIPNTTNLGAQTDTWTATAVAA